jgi:ribosomal protein S28E/S33
MRKEKRKRKSGVDMGGVTEVTIRVGRTGTTGKLGMVAILFMTTEDSQVEVTEKLAGKVGGNPKTGEVSVSQRIHQSASVILARSSERVEGLTVQLANVTHVLLHP